MLAEFFEWWGGQLADLIPERLRSPEGGSDALIADASDPGVLTLLRRRRGTLTRLTQGPRDNNAIPSLRPALSGKPSGEKILLRINPSMVLERSVTLPLAAERDLARVLGYEMERLTPFTAAELVWDYAVQQRDRAQARLSLRLTMVPRASIDPLIGQLRDQGAAPQAIEALLPDGTRTLKLDQMAPPSTLLPARSLAFAAAALAVLVTISPFLRQSIALSDEQDRLDLMAPRIAQVNTLRSRIAGTTAGGDAVAAETRRLGDTLEALSAVTEILPDDSYLTEFTMRDRKMTLSGLGASAPRLIAALSADQRIRAPAFTAPVTRSETNHNDVFAIRAELAP